jgi:hypothetical protein
MLENMDVFAQGYMEVFTPFAPTLPGGRLRGQSSAFFLLALLLSLGIT